MLRGRGPEGELNFRRIVQGAVDQVVRRGWVRAVTPSATNILVAWGEDHRSLIEQAIEAEILQERALSFIAFEQLEEAFVVTRDLSAALEQGRLYPTLQTYDPAVVRRFGGTIEQEIASAQIGAFAVAAGMVRRCSFPPIRPIDCRF